LKEKKVTEKKVFNNPASNLLNLRTENLFWTKSFITFDESSSNEDTQNVMKIEIEEVICEKSKQLLAHYN